MESDSRGRFDSGTVSANRAASLALASFLAEYNWPLRVPTGEMTPRQLWNCDEELLASMMKLPAHSIPRLSAFKKSFSAAQSFQLLERNRVSLIALGEKNYPACLAQIHDPPPALFIYGGAATASEQSESCRESIGLGKLLDRMAAFVHRPRIAIVGARAASRYGIDAAIDIARSLAREGVCVVSGMALGIDAAAHRGSLAEPGGSIAVLGCGPDVVYPRANRGLYAELLEHGLVMSEYPPGTRPLPWRFPARNRIMAGLADGVIVVEARSRSGALITADFCLEEGREVFALPGSIFSELSEGPHQLIKNGAVLITGAREVLENLGVENPEAQGTDENTSAPVDLSDRERRLFEVLDSRPRHQDALATRAGIDGAETAAILVQLELRGLARLDPGHGYTR